MDAHRDHARDRRLDALDPTAGASRGRSEARSVHLTRTTPPHRSARNPSETREIPHFARTRETAERNASRKCPSRLDLRRSVTLDARKCHFGRTPQFRNSRSGSRGNAYPVGTCGRWEDRAPEGVRAPRGLSSPPVRAPLRGAERSECLSAVSDVDAPMSRS